MNKLSFLWLAIFLANPFILKADDGDDFFGIKSDTQDDVQTSTTLENKDPNPLLDIDLNQFTTLNEVALKVNDQILTTRDVQIFFALKQLSSFLAQVKSTQELKENMALVLGLESYIKTNNYTQVIPSRSDIDKKIEFLNMNVGTKTLKDTLEKIDPSKTLSQNDIKRFFYYQALYEKGFIFLLQQQLLSKIFTPREDEMKLLYKDLSQSNPALFSSSGKISLLTILIEQPKTEQKREQIIDQLMNLKSEIMKSDTFEHKKFLFKRGIQKYSTRSLKTTKVIGPLDEELVTQDFPEYKDLFLLDKGTMSNIIENEGMMRVVFIVDKEKAQLKSIDDPQIKGRLMNMLYEKKSRFLFENFLKQNLEKMTIEYL